MAVLKYKEGGIVQILSSFRQGSQLKYKVFTEERTVKVLGAHELHGVQDEELFNRIEDIKTNKMVSLREYKAIRNQLGG